MLLFPILAVSVLCLALAGILYQAIGSARDARRYPPPGRMVDIGGFRLHVEITGCGEPPVVLESGIAASSLNWQLVQPGLAGLTTVCRYDRAGLGWSEAARTPRTLRNILGDFDAMLAGAGLRGPLILAGHSFGGLVALEYAQAHRDRVAGLVLVDPLPAGEWNPPPPEQAALLRRGVALSRRGAWAARLGVVRISLDLLRAGSRRIPQLAARVASGRGSRVTERLVGEVRKLPPELWPAVQSHWCQPKCFLAMAGHLEALPESAAGCVGGGLGDLPVIVLSAADSSPARAAEHRAMAARSTRGKTIIAERSGHWIQLDQPGLVLEALREVVLAVRSQTATLP